MKYLLALLVVLSVSFVGCTPADDAAKTDAAPAAATTEEAKTDEAAPAADAAAAPAADAAAPATEATAQ